MQNVSSIYTLGERYGIRFAAAALELRYRGIECSLRGSLQANALFINQRTGRRRIVNGKKDCIASCVAGVGHK